MEMSELKEKYYSLEDSYERYILVQGYLADHKEDEDAQEMLEVLTMRYGNAKLRKPADHFMHACLIMKVMVDEKFGSFMLAKKHLARTYIHLSKKNHSKSYFFGMGKRDDQVVVGNVADEIVNIFVRLPKRLGYTKEVSSLCKIVMDTFLEEFPNEEEILNSAIKK